MSTNRDVTLSDLKRFIAEHHRSWFSDLTAMDDEVRDRSILVQVHDEEYPINDSFLVYQVFSEVGWIEEFCYISIASGFQYRICFRDVYAAHCAFNFYNGRYVSESCRFEVSFVNEVIRSHVQTVFDGFHNTTHKELYTIAETSHQTDELIQEGAAGFKISDQSIQMEVKNELIVAMDPADFVAHKVVDETLDQETPLLSWNEKKGHLKAVDNQIFATKNIDLAAYQVFDEMPEFMEKRIELFDAFPTETGCSEIAASINKKQATLSFDPGGAGKLVGNIPLISEIDKGIVDGSKMQGSAKDYKDQLAKEEHGTQGSLLHCANLSAGCFSLSVIIAGACVGMWVFDPGGKGDTMGDLVVSTLNLCVVLGVQTSANRFEMRKMGVDLKVRTGVVKAGFLIILEDKDC